MESAVELSRRGVWTRALSIIVKSAFAVAVLIYVAFYTDDFSLFQKLVVLLVAIILYGAAVSILKLVRAGRRGVLRGWW